ncbi:hypothetical protein GLYMA_01G042500v4 [Glycine max]|uniref:2-oxoadipate dioxygenase/decarboxylase n=1 Tax=Glycine max TaxID=3847 RepID=A0A0R0L6C4_SOYBN|nr:hypothetical protein GYH30_000442 [Glycine max]KRH74780.1 hypothetical protein GLYMA_01G042500v4 [Glycine max]
MFATTKSSTLSPLFSFSRTTTSVPSKPKFWNLVPMNQSSSPGHLALGLDNPRRTLHVFCGSTSQHASQRSSIQAILDLVHSAENNSLCYDHLAFRTFGVNGYGIDSMASFFLDYGYTQREELRFPAKKLRALWFSPPADSLSSSGSGINGPLPRILFISELLVDQMSSQTQYSALASSLGRLTWEKPLYCEFQQLASQGYALSHVTISTHRLKTHLKDIKKLNQFIEDSGFRLNSEGGGLKEFHRRDGFEVASADKIFESTSKEQLSRVGS